MKKLLIKNDKKYYTYYYVPEFKNLIEERDNKTLVHK